MKRRLVIYATSSDVEGETFGHTQAVHVRARLVVEKDDGSGFELASFAGVASEERDLGPELEGFLNAVRAEVQDVLRYMAEETEQTTVVE